MARGDAERIVQEAEAYKEQAVDLAQGDAQRFISVLTAYKLAPDVTARRLYIETLEAVLKNAQKIIIDPAAKGIVPYLPLPELGKGRPAGRARGDLVGGAGVGNLGDRSRQMTPGHVVAAAVGLLILAILINGTFFVVNQARAGAGAALRPVRQTRHRCPACTSRRLHRRCGALRRPAARPSTRRPSR